HPAPRIGEAGCFRVSGSDALLAGSLAPGENYEINGKTSPNHCASHRTVEESQWRTLQIGTTDRGGFDALYALPGTKA
ncbi:MAG: hypothetical protein KGK12_09140, partial [Armatimonadetes bacterium]|nr:hypothetical protein [Armatimonadota bacterium]